MTRLLIDVGNTRIKWSLQTAEGIAVQQALMHRDLADAQLHDWLAACGPVSEVRIANVAGATWAMRLTQASLACWNLLPCFATSKADAVVGQRRIQNAYREPQKLGVDRWLALLAVAQACSAPALVVSAGTALTLDALLPDGRHVGGLIVPGMELMMQSLMQDTSNIAAHASADILDTQAWFADNTLSCVHRGAHHAASALIESALCELSRLTNEPKANVSLYLTGGAATALLPSLPSTTHWQADLVLRGLALDASC